MSNLFGSGGQPVATQATRYNGMQVQASQYGMGLPIVYGQQRIAGTLIWYGDFQSVEHQQSVGKGGGGTSTSYTYSSSFQLALCEGPVTALATIWKDSGTTTLGDINGTFSAGSSSQAAWSHLSGAAALQYPNTAWIGCVNLALGGSPNVPNFNFEIAGLLQYGSGIVDSDPSAIFSDLLTSTTHGLGFQFLGSLTQYHDYCLANNIFLSLVVDQQTTVNEILTRLLQVTNSNTAWSNGQLTVIPYGDQSATANGVTYTPATTVQKSFTDSDYVKPVKVDRKPLADLYNVIRVEYVNRSNNYNTSVAEAKDQADIESTFSIRQQEMIQGHAITNATLAQQTAQTLLQRALYIRNTYTFTTTMENVAFEPGDVIALTDSQAELVAEPVRIKSISEQGTNELQFVCEEFPAGVASGATQTVEAPAGYVPSVNGAPDATQPAVIFRAPQFLTDGTPEVWIGVGSAGSNWGGANVLVSLDNVSYQKVGTVAPGCRYGELTAALATSAVDPDTTNSYSVSLYAGGTLSGGTHTEADNLATLMLIDTELVAYSSTTLNGDGTYTLGNGYLRRGCYQTAIAAHSIGAPWIRVDDSVFRWQVDPSWVGQTVYIKIQPWNLYGGGLVSESSLTAITYVVGTAEEIPDTPPTPTSLAAAGAANGILLTWDTPNPAAVSITSVEYSSTGTSGWAVLGQVQGTHYAHVFSGNATWYYRIRARSPAFIWSAYTATVSAAGGSVDYVADGASFVKLLASHAAGNVAYNFKGIWSSATAYVKGDEVIEGQTYWVATAGSTNSTPSTSNANWQTVGSYAAFQGAWVSTTAYVPGSEVTYSGNYWICVTANTNSAPTTSNANWQVAGPTNLDFVPDGFTFQRVYATAITTGQIDMSKAGVIGRTLLNIADGGSRYAVGNMAGGNAVSAVDAANKALIDFSQAGHTNKTLDNISTGSVTKAIEVVSTLPAAGTAGRTVFLTSNGHIYRDNGAAWVSLGNTNLIDSSLWVLGGSGNPMPIADSPGFGDIGESATGSSQIILETAPDGWLHPMWRATSGTAAGTSGEGGWNTLNFPVDATKQYRFSVWVRPASGTTGQLYLGPGASTVADIPSGSTDSNPYFIGGIGKSGLVIGRWYLMVGYVLPSSYSGAQNYSGGIYDGTTGERMSSASDFKWVSGQTNSYHRAYQYYTSAAGTIVDFWSPRVDLCDGTEGTVNDLLATATLSALNPVTSSNYSQFINAGAVHGDRLISGSVSLDTQVADGTTYARVKASTMTSNVVDPTKGGLIALGAIPPGASTVAFSYTSTTTSITMSWTSGTIYRADGTTTTVSSGSNTISSLSASTVYYFAIYYDETAGAVAFSNGSGAVGSPAVAFTSQTAAGLSVAILNAHATFGWYSGATTASGSGGGGGGSGCCLRGDQTIELADGRVIPAADLTTDDSLVCPGGPVKVVKLRSEPWREWFRVTLSDDTTLTVAGDHRFIDPSGEQLHARELRLQQVVESQSGYVMVVGLAALFEEGAKISIEVAEPHTYYVHGILSHNKMLC